MGYIGEKEMTSAYVSRLYIWVGYLMFVALNCITEAFVACYLDVFNDGRTDVA